MAVTKVLTNLEAIGDMVGALSGMSTGLNDQAYMDGLIKSAHGITANAFDMAAAATARTGHLTHVYEFGVAGITRGQPRLSDPTSPAARLYVHEMAGEGGNQDIFYTFRTARQPNPPPTPEDTGVDSSYISKLSGKTYFFYNKAIVMETGAVVSIKPKEGNFLFVPFYGEPSMDPTNERGFMMWDSSRHGPLFSRPGAKSQGSFTAFWMNWWGNEGSKIMFEEMDKSVTMDIEYAMAEANKRAQAETVKPVQETDVPAAIATTKSLFHKIFDTVTAKRRAKKTL